MSSRPGPGQGHGWGPYWLPMLSFLVLVELGGRAPESAAALFLVLKAAVPGGLFLWYARRRRYPELAAGPRSAGPLALDFAVGLAGGDHWMAPYLIAPDLRLALYLPEALRPGDDAAFDPQMLGASWAWLAIGLRALGYGLVTPFVEELFVRSWLARYIDVFDGTGDFRNVPIARYTLRSFTAVVVYFTLSHVPWEWPVAVAWVVATQLWFYYRKNIVSLVVVHAGSNLGILAAVALASGRVAGPDGAPLDLWFFL